MKVLMPVKVCVVPSPATVVLAAGNVIVVASVPANVMLLFAVSVLPFAMVNVAEVAGAVMVTLLMEVAVATPNVGVVSEGLVAKTSAPEPVSSVTAAARLADEGVARKVATPVPKPEMPVETGKPVAFVKVTAEGVPRLGVVSAGLVAKTNAPDPVSPVTAAARFADEGVARKVATPVPKPEMPVETGKPVAFVKVMAEGVPRLGVVSVGLVDITTLPVPVMALLTRLSLASVNTA